MSDNRHWRVEVSVNGEPILALETECLAGVPDIDAYTDDIRNCAEHLLAFIGDPHPSSSAELSRLSIGQTSTPRYRTATMSDADFDDFDDPSEGCPNCGGEGVIYMCFSEYACIDPEGGCDLCERRCDWCHSAKTGSAS